MVVLPPYEVLMPLAPWEQPAVLEQALNSLACQRPLPQRLVLSVDGSLPAGLRTVVESHWPLPILLLCGPGGDGVGVVLARGMEVCRCELILRADADDLSLPHRAARQLAWMAANPQVVAGSGWMEEFVDRPEQVVSCRYVPVGKEVQHWARWRNPLNHPAVALRRSAVFAVGGYRDQPGFEDFDLWLRLLRRYGPASVNNLPEVLVLARVGAAHLGRRRGFDYATAEIRFLWRSAWEGQMAWCQMLLLLGLRLPWRLLPGSVLAWLMDHLRHQNYSVWFSNIFNRLLR